MLQLIIAFCSVKGWTMRNDHLLERLWRQRPRQRFVDELMTWNKNWGGIQETLPNTKDGAQCIFSFLPAPQILHTPWVWISVIGSTTSPLNERNLESSVSPRMSGLPTPCRGMCAGNIGFVYMLDKLVWNTDLEWLIYKLKACSQVTLGIS